MIVPASTLAAVTRAALTNPDRTMLAKLGKALTDRAENGHWAYAVTTMDSPLSTGVIADLIAQGYTVQPQSAGRYVISWTPAEAATPAESTQSSPGAFLGGAAEDVQDSLFFRGSSGN